MNDSPYGLINVKYDGSSVAAPTTNKMSRSIKIELIFVASIIGFAVLGFDYCSEIYVKLLKKTPIMDYYFDSEALKNIVQAFYSVFAIMIPFLVALIFIKLMQKNTVILPLWKPNSKKFFFASLAIAFLTVVISNFLTSISVMMAESVGFEFEGGKTVVAESVTGFLWQILSVAIVPAFAEEFAIRGVVLQSLRKYGETFAIVVSSVLFGIMHGNMMQAPFAFLLGVAISWLVIKTDSLWTGIAIHLMNNFYAICVTELSEVASNVVYVGVVAVVNVVGSLLGVLAIVWLVDKYKVDFRLQNSYGVQPFFVEIIAIPFMVAIVFLLVDCVETVTYVGIGS